MPLNPYLNFEGNTREVVTFYAQVFGLEVPYMMTFGEMPASPDAPLPPGTENLVIHTHLNIAGSTLMFSDVLPGMPYRQGNNISLCLVTKDKEAVKDAYHKLKEGGTVVMELQETPWSSCYGQVTDQYGMDWQFSYDGES